MGQAAVRWYRRWPKRWRTLSQLAVFILFGALYVVIESHTCEICGRVSGDIRIETGHYVGSNEQNPLRMSGTPETFRLCPDCSLPAKYDLRQTRKQPWLAYAIMTLGLLLGSLLKVIGDGGSFRRGRESR